MPKIVEEGIVFESNPRGLLISRLTPPNANRYRSAGPLEVADAPTMRTYEASVLPSMHFQLRKKRPTNIMAVSP